MKLKLLGVLAVILVVALAGCGGDDNNSSDTNTSATTNTSTTTTPSGGGGGAESVDVSLTDFKIDPADPKVAKAGTVTFNVKNDGGTVHSLEVEGPSGEKKLASNLNPGQTGKLTVDLSKAGTYEWYCPIDDHKKFGMKGEITVGSGGGTTTSSQSETNTTETQSSDNSGSGGGSGGSGGGY